MNSDLATKIQANIATSNGGTVDTVGGDSNTCIIATIATTRVQVLHGDESDLSDAAVVPSNFLVIGDDDGVMTSGTTTAGTQGTVTDTTTYPLATQATNTEIITVDGGAAQTVTFTTAIDTGSILDTTSYPVADQDTNVLGITFDGGTEQDVTFSGATTTAAHVIEQINDQVTGGYAEAAGAQVRIYSSTSSATSAVAVNVTACDLTFAAAADINHPAGIASEINSQTYGLTATVVSDQVVLTSDGYGDDSAIVIGTGTTDLTWDTAVDGSGDSGAYVLYSESGTGVIGYVGKKRYVSYNITNPATDTTVLNLKGDLSYSPTAS